MDESNNVVVAHISDLHFGAPKWDSTVLELLHTFVETQMVDCLLVTGDIADSPKKELFEEARRALDSFGRPYFVCAGNHDRHILGNNFGGLLTWSQGPEGAPAWFESVFRERLCKTQPPFTEVTVGQTHNQWTLRLASVDTSERSDFAARGYVPLNCLDSLTYLRNDADNIDLVILLAHHHPLPVRELEQRNFKAKADLGKFTTLVNAGSLLEIAAAANVDLITHGHEHAPNAACYRSLKARSGRLAVLGAGSALGNKTLAGFDPTRMSLNLLRLTPRRSVHLEMWARGATEWVPQNCSTVFNPTQLRRSKFLRKLPRQDETQVQSEVLKLVEVTPDGDLRVKEVRTEWPVGSELTIGIKNATGVPRGLNVTVGAKFPSMRSWRPQKRLFKEDRKLHSWIFRCDVPPEYATHAQTLSIEYYWKGGAVLTADQLGSSSKAGPMRSEGYEYTAHVPQRPLAALTLMVRLPEGYTPSSTDVKVFTQLAGKDDEPLRERPEITERLRQLDSGTYLVTIPFPWIGFRYALAWKPVKRKRLGRSPKSRTRNS